jgi:hypothetical protein
VEADAEAPAQRYYSGELMMAGAEQLVQVFDFWKSVVILRWWVQIVEAGFIPIVSRGGRG